MPDSLSTKEKRKGIEHQGGEKKRVYIASNRSSCVFDAATLEFGWKMQKIFDALILTERVPHIFICHMRISTGEEIINVFQASRSKMNPVDFKIVIEIV